MSFKLTFKHLQYRISKILNLVFAMMKSLSFLKKLTTGLIASTILISSVFAEPTNLDCLKQRVIKYYDTGEYNRDVNTIATKAKNYINYRVRKNNHLSRPHKLALVLDIDETVLSNYHHMVARQFAGTKTQFHKEVLAANDPAIKPMLKLYQDAINKKVAVFFVTGRNDAMRQATFKNLRRAGLSKWEGIYFKPQNYNQKSIIPFKSSMRKAIEKKGYTIIASIGDQYSDLAGGYAARTFKLPNPYYFLP